MEKSIENNLENIKSIFVKYNAKSAYIFGSMTKNNYHEKSDVDFLFSFHDNLDYETYSLNYFSLLNELENLLQKPIELVAEKTLKNKYLIESINESKFQII
jgi:predicted nucleotidyltransferase